MDNYNVNIFKQFKKDWALLTVLDGNCVNAMTIGWGEFGTVWGKNVVTVYVKPNQKTYDLLQKTGIFYLHFFDDEYKEDLKLLGSVSGYDTQDKFAQTSIKPYVKDGEVFYRDAVNGFVCKKLYQQFLNCDLILDNEITDRYYEDDTQIHQMIIAQVFFQDCTVIS